MQHLQDFMSWARKGRKQKRKGVLQKMCSHSWFTSYWGLVRNTAIQPLYRVPIYYIPLSLTIPSKTLCQLAIGGIGVVAVFPFLPLRFSPLNVKVSRE